MLRTLSNKLHRGNVSTDGLSVTGFVQTTALLLGPLQISQDVNALWTFSTRSRNSLMQMGNSLKFPPQLNISHQRKERSSRMLVHGCKRMTMILSLMFVSKIISLTDNSPNSRTFSGNSKSIYSLECSSRRLDSLTGTCLTWLLMATIEYTSTGHCGSTTLPMIYSGALMSSTFGHDQTWWCCQKKKTIPTPINMDDWSTYSQYQYTTRAQNQWWEWGDRSCRFSGCDGMRGTHSPTQMGFPPYASLDSLLWMQKILKLMGSLTQLLSFGLLTWFLPSTMEKQVLNPWRIAMQPDSWPKTGIATMLICVYPISIFMKSINSWICLKLCWPRYVYEIPGWRSRTPVYARGWAMAAEDRMGL